MTNPGGIGGAVPAGEDWLVRRIQDLERELREFKAASTLQAATVSAGGIQLINGGTLQVVDSNGNVTATIGALPAAFNRADGSPQPGLIFNRPDGSMALLLGDHSPTVPPYSAAFQVFDRLGGKTVLSDDTNSGHGLANPHLDSGGMENTNIATWPATNATSFTTIANKFMEFQNPVLTWQIQMYADAGITGQFKLLVNGIQVGTTQTVSAATFGTWSSSAPIPATVNVGDTWLVELQAKASATTGSAHAVCLRISGYQS